MQVAVDEVSVGQVERGRAHDAVHHLRRVVKEPLVVRAEGRAVGDDQGLLAGATRPAAALRVVGRRGGHVAQVDGIERRDVDAQLHGGRAEHHRQALKRCLVRRIFCPVLAIFLGEPEALLQQLAAAGIDLRGVLVGFELEEGVVLLAQRGRDRKVELAEETVVLALLLGLGGIDQHPVHG